MTKRAKQQQGLTLLETTLTLGALSALTLGIYMVLAPANATAQAKREQDNLRDISTAVESSFGLLGSFSGVSTSRVMEDRLMPSRMWDGSTIRSAWGVAVDVFPNSVNRPNDSFVVVYPLTPPEVCAKLAAAVARDVFDLRVNTVSVMTANGLDVAATAAACSERDSADMEFIYHSGLVSGTAVAAAPIVLAPDTTVGNDTSATPATIVVGDAGDVGDAAGVSPILLPPGAPALPPPPPAPAAGTSPPITGTPPVGTGTTIPTNEVECLALSPGPQTDTRTQWCPAGQVGHREQERHGSYSCPEAWDAPVWSGWSNWTTVASTCTPCPSPQTQTLGCPVGQTGQIVRERTFLCSGETGSWNGWAVVSNTCAPIAPACVAPAPTTATRTTTPCPPGQSGTITEQQTTTYVCPAPTGPFTSSVGGWAVVSNTCAPTAVPCVAPAPTTATRTTTPCPPGQSGTITEQQTTTYVCPAPTGPFTSSVGGWAVVSNTCAPTSVYTTQTLTGCYKGFRSSDVNKQIIGHFAVGTDNPAGYSVAWAGLPIGGPLNQTAAPWTNPAPNELRVTADCAIREGEWGYRATATHISTGTVYTTDFTCRCINLGL